MNQPTFCADGSRAVAENPIGNASTHRVYVLIECPTPWEYRALESSPIPSDLKTLPKELYDQGKPARFLLIHNSKLAQPQQHRVIILEGQEGWSQGYKKQEYQVNDLGEIPAIVEQVLAGSPPVENAVESQTRDFLVCTHGSHDQCCARYGKPFFYAANQLIEELSLGDQVRVWEASHFGGHRFAPTVIDFPSGRYYGGLEPTALKAILQQTEVPEAFAHMYRGWGILPETAQVLEQTLILQEGWNWFQNRVFLPVQVIKKSDTEELVTLWYQQPNGKVGGYEASVVHDPNENICIYGSCHASHPSTFINWKVTQVKPLKADQMLSSSA